MAEYDSKIQIARNTIENKIILGRPFSYEEAKEDILGKGGILRAGNSYTIEEYFNDLENKGIIHYNPKLDKFEVLKQN